MKRRDFLKVSGMVGAAAATVGMDFVDLPAGKEALLEDPGVIRWNVQATSQWVAAFQITEEEFQRLIEYALSEARAQARSRGWKDWEEKVIKTAPKDRDADCYEVVLLKPKNKLAEVLSRYVQRAP